MVRRKLTVAAAPHVSGGVPPPAPPPPAPSNSLPVAVRGSAVGRGVAPQLWTAHPRGPSQNIPIRASKGFICPDLGEIGFGRGRGFSPVVFPTRLLLVCTFRFGGTYLFRAFGLATLAAGVRVEEGFIDSGDAVPVAVLVTTIPPWALP